MRPRLFLPLLLLLGGCAAPPSAPSPPTAKTFPPDGVIVQRGILTARGRQTTLNGYLAQNARGARHLVITENFGGVLAEVLIKPDGSAQVLRSSRAFKPEWIRRYIAADVACLFGDARGGSCRVETLGPGHFVIHRRWYQLDLQTVSMTPGPQPPEMFESPPAAKP